MPIEFLEVLVPRRGDVVITSCFGERFWQALGPWLTHLRALQNSAVEIISLDGKRYDGADPNVTTFLANTARVQLKWGGSDALRLERVLSYLDQGRTCVQIDLDVKMKRDFTSLIDLPYDFIVSRAYVFPQFAREQLGFVACTGFYIAKPSAKQFCAELLRRIQGKTDESGLDQWALNTMLCESIADHVSQTDFIQLAGRGMKLDFFTVGNCRVAVLPPEAVARNANTATSVYGNHDQAMIAQYLAGP